MLGFGTEAIGTDAGQGFHLRPPYPCHYYMHGAGRYGLQCLANLDLLPPTGAVLICPPLKIEKGSGSPLRVLALVEDGRPRLNEERSPRSRPCRCAVSSSIAASREPSRTASPACCSAR